MDQTITRKKFAKLPGTFVLMWIGENDFNSSSEYFKSTFYFAKVKDDKREQIYTTTELHHSYFEFGRLEVVMEVKDKAVSLIGTIWEGGKIKGRISDNIKTTELHVRQTSTTDTNFRKVFNVSVYKHIPKDDFFFYLAPKYDRYSFLIFEPETDPGQTYLLPCQELIRFYFGESSNLLESAYQGEKPYYEKLTEFLNNLYPHENWIVLRKFIEDGLAKKVAAIYYNRGYRDSFNKVYDSIQKKYLYNSGLNKNKGDNNKEDSDITKQKRPVCPDFQFPHFGEFKLKNQAISLSPRVKLVLRIVATNEPLLCPNPIKFRRETDAHFSNFENDPKPDKPSPNLPPRYTNIVKESETTIENDETTNSQVENKGLSPLTNCFENEENIDVINGKDVKIDSDVITKKRPDLQEAFLDLLSHSINTSQNATHGGYSYTYHEDGQKPQILTLIEELKKIIKGEITIVNKEFPTPKVEDEPEMQNWRYRLQKSVKIGKTKKKVYLYRTCNIIKINISNDFFYIFDINKLGDYEKYKYGIISNLLKSVVVEENIDSLLVEINRAKGVFSNIKKTKDKSDGDITSHPKGVFNLDNYIILGLKHALLKPDSKGDQLSNTAQDAKNIKDRILRLQANAI